MLRHYLADAGHRHESQRDSLRQQIRVARVEASQGNHVNLAIQQGPEIKFKVDLMKNRSLGAEFNEEVNVRAFAVFATGY